MPKKSKVKKTTQKQKQRQSQNVKVIVNVPEKKQRKKRVKRPPRETQGVDFKAFPPQIIYPQQPLTFYPASQTPSLAKSVSESIPIAPSILEDIGQVGTEGRVEILSLPSKSQTLEELENLVPIRTPKIPVSLAELAMKTKMPKSISEDVGFGIAPEEVYQEEKKEKKKRKTKGELRQEMELEYQNLTGTPIKPEVTNKELKALIYAEKNRKRMSKTLGKIMGEN